jgi:hypothetical protein
MFLRRLRSVATHMAPSNLYEMTYLFLSRSIQNPEFEKNAGNCVFQYGIHLFSLSLRVYKLQMVKLHRTGTKSLCAGGRNAMLEVT